MSIVSSSTPLQRPIQALPFGPSDAIHLGLVKEKDLPFLLSWRNEQLAILRQSSPLSMEEHLTYWHQKVWPEMEKPLPQQLLFSYQEGPHLIGYGGLVYIDWEKKRAEVSTLLNTALANSPHFLAITRKYLTLTFELAGKLGLKTLHTECFDTRIDMIGLLENLGFIRQEYHLNKKESFGFKLGSWSHVLIL